MLQIGQTISAYQLLAHIASGGQATVYRARHTVLQREVALKVLHPHLLTAPDFVEKFAREAQLLAQLKHPNIVEVYDANRDAATGLYFIAIEFLPGTDLETLIAQQGKLAVEVVVAVAQQVASALEYAHARNLIHRDIKPSNLMLLPDGTVKVLDFGIAAIIAAGQKARTRIGTVEYMAPEHFAGNADARSDIYSLGATLYHCLTGQLPPVIAVQPPTPPRQLNPAISPALENVILKALQADPARRQQTGREFIIEIESARHAPPVAVSAPAAMACPHCGAANRVEARHCATCGKNILTEDAALEAARRLGLFMLQVPAPEGIVLKFCTRCGQEVSPYRPSTVSLRDFYEYGIDPPERIDGQPSYWCPRCRKTWLATNLADTGYDCEYCGTFMPWYVSFCGVCGAKRKR
jgi:tRNA A-37 threonylcarbamoyl transferase component Bud32/uncharacterized protein (DUF983 family)